MSSDAIETRIWHIEKQLRRAKYGIIVLGVMLAISIGVAVVPFLTGRIVVRNMVIRDSEGRSRISLTTNSDGRPLLMLKDASGKPKLVMGYNLFDEPSISVGKFGPGTWIGLTEEGQPALRLHDGAGSNLVELGVGPDGRPVVQLAQEPEQSEARPPVDGDLRARESGC